ncbi:MAG: VPLPA-CTERM sorting domain-containing protein [Pseudomonadota bacterium]|nr:VPLPA-CTERM sorting domain-containing protein [Pseudomonadota bacterium]
MRPTCHFGVTAAFAIAASSAWAVPTTSSVSGANAAAVQPTVDAFRASLGPLNANVAGSFGSGRREINWDGVPVSLAAPNSLPADFFNTNSPRGVVLSTPGTGFQVSGTPIEFGNIHPSYPGLFAAFSPTRLFTAIGSNVTDVSFFVPGSSVVASVSGFGVVFTDVDLPNVTSLQFFDLSNSLLGTFYAPPTAGIDQGFSFIGVAFSTERIGRVRITAGNQVLGGVEVGDLVVMDDFIYSEPGVTAVPEPASMWFLLGGLSVVGALSRRRRAGR